MPVTSFTNGPGGLDAYTQTGIVDYYVWCCARFTKHRSSNIFWIVNMFFYLLISLLLSSYASNIEADEVIGCGGFVQSKAKLNYDAIKVKL